MSSPASSSRPHAGQRVWIVDDSPLEREVARSVLAKQYDVREFADGASLLEAVAAGELLPATLVLDHELPGMSGLDVTAYLRRDRAAQQLPILILSGARADSEDVAAALRAGANDYVLKPFSDVELLARVEGLVEMRTQRLRADEAEKNLRRQLQHLPDAFVAVDADERINFANRKMVRVTGVDGAELIGRSLGDVIPALRGVKRETGIIADIVIGERIFTPALGRLTLDSDEGETFTITLSDVTDKVRAIEQRDRFLATLAHELRNPLAAIVSALELVSSASDDAAAVERGTRVATSQTGTLNRIIDDLLDVARVSRGKIEVRLEPIEVAVVVAKVVESAEPLIKSKQHVVKWHAPATPILVLADSLRFEQMLANLVTNACKYTDPGGQIDIAARRDGDSVVIGVRDNGIGIAPQMLDRVFEMFTQVGPTLARSGGGLGIGLQLVRQLAELQSGTVSVHSDGLGKGSEFSLRLPVAKRAQADARVASAPAPVAHVRKRVLVVDDNVDAGELLGELVARRGHDVRVVHDGETALHLAAELRPDIVFLDVDLPGIDGHEVARRMRGELGMTDARIVALTGFGQPADVTRALEAGCSDHMTKPINMRAIQAVLTGE